MALIGVLAAVLAALGSVAAIFASEGRRIRRSLRHVLKSDPHALLIARGRGRGAGFNFTSNTLAVTWDTGAWCLVYRIDELMGAELIVDDRVTGRVFRGEDRRPLDMLGGAENLVRLRLIFDDPRSPDFDLDLWTPGDDRRRNPASASEATQEANRWLARTESLFRRKAPVSAARVAEAAAVSPAKPPQPAAEPPARAASGRQELLFDMDDDLDDEAVAR